MAVAAERAGLVAGERMAAGGARLEVSRLLFGGGGGEERVTVLLQTQLGPEEFEGKDWSLEWAVVQYLSAVGEERSA